MESGLTWGIPLRGGGGGPDDVAVLWLLCSSSESEEESGEWKGVPVMTAVMGSSVLNSPLSREEPLPLSALSFLPFPLLPLSSSGWTLWGKEGISSCAWLLEMCVCAYWFGCQEYSGRGYVCGHWWSLSHRGWHHHLARCVLTVLSSQWPEVERAVRKHVTPATLE